MKILSELTSKKENKCIEKKKLNAYLREQLIEEPTHSVESLFYKKLTEECCKTATAKRLVKAEESEL